MMRHSPHLPRLLVASALSVLLLLAGCSNTTVTVVHTATPSQPTPSPTGTVSNPYRGTALSLNPCSKPSATAQPEERFWTRNVIAVSLVLTNHQLPDPIALKNVVNGIFKLPQQQSLDYEQSSIGLPAIIQVDQTAIAFFAIQQAGLQCDDNLKLVVDTLNSSVLQANGPISVPGAWISGSSPDFYAAGAPGGGDGVHGSPSSLPIPTSMTAQAPPANKPLSAATPVVFVLDTGYQVGQTHAVPAKCNDGACVPLATALSLPTPQNPAAAALMTDLGNNLRESDLGLADETSFEDFGKGSPFTIKDHGIFASELIHWLAPTAQIRLIRVLNDYGIGDLQAFALALHSILNDPGQFNITTTANTPYVVNLSLNFGPSLDCLSTIWTSWHDTGDLNVDGSPSRPYTYGDFASCAQSSGSGFMKGLRASSPTLYQITGLYAPLGGMISDLVNKPNYTVVAAAGNDGQDDAHMPAAFCGVVAVGAVTNPGGSGYANFSNYPYLGTAPASAQCLSVSANVSAPQITLQSTQARYALADGYNLCSLYLDNNLNGSGTPGLALWSGTSFATALVTGNIAANPSIAEASTGQIKIPKQTIPCA